MAVELPVTEIRPLGSSSHAPNADNVTRAAKYARIRDVRATMSHALEFPFEFRGQPKKHG
jgi:hypothetical protein